jgi:putative transposase
MPDYRRLRIKGSTVFITLVTFNRSPFLVSSISLQTLKYTWKTVGKAFPFTTDAVCVLPDHLHMMITLPENDSDYSLRIREIKRLFTRRYTASVGEVAFRNYSRIDKKEATIWQRRFWEYTIRDEQDYENHFNYIHYNPVKHGLVKNVSSWPWSSFHRHVRMGIYEPGWGDDLVLDDQKNVFGE